MCKFNQEGFCRFGTNCLRRHENEICPNRSVCENPECSKRHPKSCKYFYQFGECKFREACAYSHKKEIKNNKVEELEREVAELKEDMRKLKEDMMKKMDSILLILNTEEEVEVLEVT